MWLWKKFWNIDIIGKIYILIIVVIMILAMTTIVIRYKNNSTIQVVNKNQNYIIEEDVALEQDIIAENTNAVADVVEDIKDEVIAETLKQPENNKSEITQQGKTTTNTEKTEIKDTVTTSTEQPVVIVTDKDQTNVETTEKNKSDDYKQEQQEMQQEPKQEDEDTKDEIVQEPSEPIVTEEYKVNNEMINKMKEVILNNPSEDMKTYGFEVVVDSSIIELTNQFTYTEQRLKDKLTFKFGTIRIYAQDYYYNGNLVMTECFII